MDGEAGMATAANGNSTARRRFGCAGTTEGGEMNTWILILLFINTYGHESTSMTSVNGFVSESSCKYAAQQAEQKFTLVSSKKAYALCVKA